jgi:DNA sulfur modification protein DndC
MSDKPVRRRSFFEELGFSATIAEVCNEIRGLYLADDTPWVIGYSGGKDSTAVTQLVWLALSELSGADRNKKPVYVITTDTLVENPIVAGWVRSSLNALRTSAAEKQLPYHPELLEPPTADSFWVNLIGKGYPAPRTGFRWCTERLKIKPASRFIENTASRYGEAILLLGARKAESAVRSASLSRREHLSKEGLTAHPELVSTLVYAPIQDWSNDDVWTFLMRSQNPWGISNKDLMVLYRGATEDNECPIVVDTSTPSCGNSRFGCWVCTLVDQDKSMKAMIQNDVDKSWMRPLLELRNELDFRGDEARQRELERRDFRRLRGSPQLNRTRDDLIPGPYTQLARAQWLEKLLQAQMTIRRNPDAPPHVKEIELISAKELRAIRKIWLEEKHEIEDLLPRIVETVTDACYVEVIDEAPVLDPGALQVLEAAASGDRLHYETLRNLLDIEYQFRKGGTAVARRGLFRELQGTLENGFFVDRADALEWVKARDQSGEPAIDDRPDFRVQRGSEIPALSDGDELPLIADRDELGLENSDAI